MATKKLLSLIFDIQNFGNSYLGKVTKFQGNSLLHLGVLSHLLGWMWKTPPPLVLIGSNLFDMGFFESSVMGGGGGGDEGPPS